MLTHIERFSSPLDVFLQMMKKIALAFLCVILCGSLRVTQADDRPNILWVTSEDNSHHWLGCYGNEQVSTPNIDQLAADGVRYEFAYSNAPVCAVARSTLITGRYACSIGTQNMRSRYPIPSDIHPFVSYLRDSGYYCVNRSKTDYNFKTDDKSHWDDSSNNAHWKKRPEGKPFFAVFNTGISHESSLFEKKKTSARNSGMIPETPSQDPASVTLPPFLPDTPEIRDDWVTYLDILAAMDKQIGDWLAELDDAGLRENTIVVYYSDHGGILPRAKRYIYDTGTHVPMIVRCPKKFAHLVPGRPGSTSDRPVSFVDLAPTTLSLAGVDIPQGMQGRAFLGAQKQEAAPYVFLFGQRFDARMLRFVRAVTDGHYRYIRNFNPHRHRGILAGYPHSQSGWRSFYALQQAGQTDAPQSAFWKVPQPVEELYDTQNDPWEIKNLAADPAHAKRLKKMRAATFETMKNIRDTGLVPEAMYNRISEKGTVYGYVQSPKFPYEKVLGLAVTACDGDVQVLPELEEAMKSEHAVVRYWGAVGCTVRGQRAASAAGLLRSLLRDSEPAVQLAAAEALIATGERQDGLQGLVDVLRNTRDEMVVLEALYIAAAYQLTGSIPKPIYEQACQTGKYTQGMLSDYPNNS